jgi:hypothetical protein
MHDEKHIILGVHITDRIRDAAGVQRVFTEFGCNIKTRLGLHHVTDDVCSPRGLILLEVHGDESVAETMAERLSAFEGVQVRTMVFDHP